jgi:eukaryotic-like serine/threonine-protein kinase
MRICPECEQTFEDAVLRCPNDGEATVSLPDKPVNQLVGTVLDGRWRIERLLGEGGMGAVFTGRQINLDRPVAIKVLQPALAARDLIIARFMREGRVMSALRHPHIVTILDFGRDEQQGLLYLVMELLEGQPLNAWLRANRPTYQQVLDIIEQTARALDCAHQGQVIHRDLKPHNIFLTPMGATFHLKVLDFGIAKLQAADASMLTNTGDIQGTPHYMAPEQIAAGQIVPQTDLYSLGVMLYELITGRVPFEAPSSLPIFFKHCHEEPPPIEGRWALEVPPQPELITLTMALLEKDPALRPASAQALIERLNALRTPDLSLSWETAMPALASTLDLGASSRSLELGAAPPSFATPVVNTPVTRPQHAEQAMHTPAAQPAHMALDKEPLQAHTQPAATTTTRPGVIAASAFGLGAVATAVLALVAVVIGLIVATSMRDKPASGPSQPAALSAPTPAPDPAPPIIAPPDAAPDAAPDLAPAAIPAPQAPDAAPDLPVKPAPKKRPSKKTRTDEDAIRDLDRINPIR